MAAKNNGAQEQPYQKFYQIFKKARYFVFLTYQTSGLINFPLHLLKPLGYHNHFYFELIFVLNKRLRLEMELIQLMPVYYPSLQSLAALAIPSKYLKLYEYTKVLKQ